MNPTLNREKPIATRAQDFVDQLTFPEILAISAFSKRRISAVAEQTRQLKKDLQELSGDNLV